MSPPRSTLRQWDFAAAAWATVAILLVLAGVSQACALQIASGNGWRDVNLDEYRRHLEQLDGVVSDCAAQLQLKNPPPAGDNACDPDRIGPDDRVRLPIAATSPAREVRYGWLRSVLSRAGKKDSGAPAVILGAHENVKNKPPDVGSLLNRALRRLKEDEQQAGGTFAAGPAYTDQRKSLDAILAKREYKGATELTARDRILEWIANLLARIFATLAGIGARAHWVGTVLVVLLIMGAFTGLILLLVRLEHNARVRLVPDIEAGPEAPSAREWQLWLKDAQAAAAGGLWREAIHSVYWASIARLESNVAAGRPWPADRARTPREYLRLLGSTDPRKPTLTALTRSFERTWYGGRQAAAADFNAALHLAAELGVEAS